MPPLVLWSMGWTISGKVLEGGNQQQDFSLLEMRRGLGMSPLQTTQCDLNETILLPMATQPRNCEELSASMSMTEEGRLKGE